jgi:hypothetical protein
MSLREHPDRVVGRIKVAWEDGDLSPVAELIHTNAALVPREGGPTFSGRDLFLSAFRRTPGFVFVREEPGAGSWQDWGDTAVFHIVIACTVDGVARRAREVWVVGRSEGIWSVVWHATFIPVP